jgi:KDO2-lipid IV(A) lauroyltransferase
MIDATRALQNLAIAFPEKSAAEREAIALAVKNLGRIMAETMVIDRITGAIAHRHRQRAHVQPLSRQARRGHRRDVAHGQLGAYIWPLTKPAKSCASPLRQESLRRPLPALAAAGSLRRFAGKGRSQEETQAVARSIMSFARQGGRLGIVCDLHDRAGIPVPFFGRPAPSVARRR